MDKLIHPWENSLGPGPYGFVKLIHSNYPQSSYSDVTVGPKGIGLCSHCGHVISNVYVIQTSDLKRFGIGSDCVRELNLVGRELRAFEHAEAQFLRKQRQEREVRNFKKLHAEIVILLDINKETLKAQAHYIGNMASNRDNRYDSAISSLSRARNTKDLKRIKQFFKLEFTVLGKILYG